MDAIILAAGIGSRVTPLTSCLPKPLFPIGNKRFLNYSLDLCKRMGIKPIVVASNKISSVLNSNSRIVTNKKPNFDLFQSLKLSQKFVKSENFLVLGADIIYKKAPNIRSLVKYHLRSRVDITFFYDKFENFPLKINKVRNKIKNIAPYAKKMRYSVPLMFVSKKVIFNYISSRPVENWTLFQRMLDAGKILRCIKLNSVLYDNNVLEDYFRNSLMLYPSGFVDKHSKILNSKIIRSFVYDSKIENSKILNSILHQAKVKNSKISNKCIFGRYTYHLKAA